MSAPSKQAGTARALVATRLAPLCAEDSWLGVCVRVVEAARHETPDAPERLPAHHLAAAWAPGAPRSRWPDAVVIGSPTADDALAELLRHLPPEAKLFLAGLDAVDAGLAARILLAADRNLAAYQREGIAAFATAEEARVTARIAAGYTDRDEGFERFRSRLLAQFGGRG